MAVPTQFCVSTKCWFLFLQYDYRISFLFFSGRPLFFHFNNVFFSSGWYFTSLNLQSLGSIPSIFRTLCSRVFFDNFSSSIPASEIPSRLGLFFSQFGENKERKNQRVALIVQFVIFTFLLNLITIIPYKVVWTLARPCGPYLSTFVWKDEIFFPLTMSKNNHISNFTYQSS